MWPQVLWVRNQVGIKLAVISISLSSGLRPETQCLTIHLTFYTLVNLTAAHTAFPGRVLPFIKSTLSIIARPLRIKGTTDTFCNWPEYFKLCLKHFFLIVASETIVAYL